MGRLPLLDTAIGEAVKPRRISGPVCPKAMLGFREKLFGAVEKLFSPSAR